MKKRKYCPIEIQHRIHILKKSVLARSAMVGDTRAEWRAFLFPMIHKLKRLKQWQAAYNKVYKHD